MGEVDDSLESKRIVFVTVGSTSFDSLVKAVDTREVREALFEKGYTHLLLQMGRGSYIPVKSDAADGFVSLDYFTFSPSIADHLKSASLVISHAGSGSIFETLRLGKPLIVVVNEDLMDNHQSELAEELAERKHLFCARAQTLFNTISEMDTKNLVPYEPVLEANPWREASKSVYVLTHQENQVCTMKTRRNRREVERELGLLFSKGTKWRSQSEPPSTKFPMLVEDVREGVLVFEDENEAAKYCDLLKGGGQNCEGVAEIEASSVFDLCRKNKALAVLFRRGRTPPVPENLKLNLGARKRSLEDQEDLV